MSDTASHIGHVSIKQLREIDAEQFARLLAGPPAQAIPWLRAAAEQNIPRAQAILAQMLLDGRCAPADPGEALYWFKLAAGNNDVLAINMVGRCYENGWGTPVDMTMAVYWYRLAAGMQLDWGMYNYANLLMNGYGTKTDRAAAFALYRQAAELGLAKAINVVGRFYEEGWEVEADAEQAYQFYEQAAQGGDFRGQFNYARMLLMHGQLAEALHWIKLIPATATPAFMTNLLAWLETSPHALLRDSAAAMMNADQINMPRA